MPDLSNIPGFTALTTEGGLPNFPVEVDSWNAPDDANSKKTTQPSFTVSGVNVTLDYGHGNSRHVMRGQGGIKGNNRQLLAYLSTLERLFIFSAYKHAC